MKQSNQSRHDTGAAGMTTRCVLLLLALATTTLAKHHSNFLSPDNFRDEYWRQAYDLPAAEAASWDTYRANEDELYPNEWQQVFEKLGVNKGDFSPEEEKDVPDSLPPQVQPDEPKTKAKPRAEEEVQQPGIGGPILHTGGSDKGEGVEKQRNPAVKTDALLPAYCDPPNPCPVGYTASKGCDDKEFQNTADYVRGYQARQECECDKDHMLECPSPKHKPQHNLQQEEKTEMEEVLQLLGMKRPSHIAKKRPYIRRRRAAKVNPYLQGPKLRRAAKKSPDHPHVFHVNGL